MRLSLFIFILVGVLTAKSSTECNELLRALIHGPIKDDTGHLVKYAPYNDDGIVLDTNLFVYTVNKGKYNDTKHVTLAGKVSHLIKGLLKHGKDTTPHIWATDQTTVEFLRARDRTFPAGTRRLQISTTRESPEYESIQKKLKEIKVGGGSDQAIGDQNVIADVLFGVSRNNKPVTFATADMGIIRPLCYLIPECAKERAHGTIPAAFRNGFTVNMTDSSGTVRTAIIRPVM